MPPQDQRDRPRSPQRVTTRVLLDFITDVIAHSARSTGGNLARSLAFFSIQHANVEHLAHAAKTSWKYAYQAPPDTQRRPIRVHALAQALSSSPETTRRQVEALISEGACIRIPGQGVIVPAAHLASPLNEGLRRHLVARFVSLIGQMKAIDFPFESPRLGATGSLARLSDDPKPDFLIARGVTHYLLRVILDGIPVYGDYVTGVLFCMIMVENTRHFTFDPEIAWRFASADQAPPDSLRVPATARQISSALGMPYSTVQRRLNQMVERGFCERRDAGYIVPNNAMDSQAMLANGLRIHTWFLSMLSEFSAVGLDVLN